MDKYNHRSILQNIARKAMIERGLEPDFPSAVLAEINDISSPAIYKLAIAKDLRNLLWCSVDNDDSLDLDQLSYAEQLSGNNVRLLVAIADVDALVSAKSNIDNHASLNTASIYTVAQVFPMLPEKLSTDLTSLSFDADRCALVVEMIIGENGTLQHSDIYCAIVCNHAKLVYDSLAAWLDGTIPMPSEIAKVEGLAENIRLQDQVAQKMRKLRYENGALEFETIEARPVFEGDDLREMKGERKNRANNMIEEFMIASNGVTARYLTEKNFPSLRRVVHTPKQWGRIVELASENGYSLPGEADSKSLSQYLKFVRQNFPQHYPDLSLSVLKLLGAGEYIVETPESIPEGHFGLAVKNYAHSTAPNRRYPDLITHRLLKSAMIGNAVPYTKEQLDLIARHCTLKEDDAKKVERQVEKSASAMLLESRIGEEFDAIVSGASPKGTWIRLFNPHLEGKLVKGFNGLKVGDKLKARLIQIEVESGFIDFETGN
jgi:VacB/RNase II family 3'-5' exoribonuclease